MNACPIFIRYGVPQAHINASKVHGTSYKFPGRSQACLFTNNKKDPSGHSGLR